MSLEHRTETDGCVSVKHWGVTGYQSMYLHVENLSGLGRLELVWISSAQTQ